MLKTIIRKTPIYDLLKLYRVLRERGRLKKISSSKPIFPLYCISCEKYYKEFKPLPAFYQEMFQNSGFPYSIHKAETLNIKNYSCHGCGISDRDRLYALYLKQKINKAEYYNLIEFAPSVPLSNFIRKFQNIKHRTADLFMLGVDDKVDLMNMSLYEDNKFDIFICSHILEHVDDDRKAMLELYRILKPGGFGIVMVPLIMDVEKTHEDPSIKDELLRWKNFGQGDHVRLYSRQDYLNRLKEAGFIVSEFGKDYFGEDVFKLNGISSSSVLYVVSKF